MTENELKQNLARALHEAGVPREKLDGFFYDVAQHHIVDGRYSEAQNKTGTLIGDDERNPNRLVAVLRGKFPDVFAHGEAVREDTSKDKETSLTRLADALRDEAIERGLAAIRAEPWRMRL